MRRTSLDRVEKRKEVIDAHEKGIREITAWRKEIAAQVSTLQQQDKELRDAALELMKKRDLDLAEL